MKITLHNFIPVYTNPISRPHNPLLQQKEIKSTFTFTFTFPLHFSDLFKVLIQKRTNDTLFAHKIFFVKYKHNTLLRPTLSTTHITKFSVIDTCQIDHIFILFPVYFPQNITIKLMVITTVIFPEMTDLKIICAISISLI